MIFLPPKKPFKALKDQIGLISIKSCFFSHQGKNFEILSTTRIPHSHSIKNLESGNVSEILHSKLLIISEK